MADADPAHYDRQHATSWRMKMRELTTVEITAVSGGIVVSRVGYPCSAG
ncbi:hypothetical protein [Burkholderia ambifaria]|jgi:hypothetical protein|nr:hypothetical protein [Burkholderia ambifaria]